MPKDARPRIRKIVNELNQIDRLPVADREHATRCCVVESRATKSVEARTIALSPFADGVRRPSDRTLAWAAIAQPGFVTSPQADPALNQ